MAFCNIDNMDVVADASAINRVVIVAEYHQFRALAGGDLGNVGHEVVGCSLRVFTNQAAFVRADRIEVAQDHELILRVGPGGILKDLLDHELSTAVWTGDILADWAVLGIWDRCRAIHGSRRAQYELSDIVFVHDFKKGKSNIEVSAVVKQWLFDRFSHGFKAGEMNNGIKRVVRKKRVELFFVLEVKKMRRNMRAGDLFDPFQDFLAAISKIVDNGDGIAALDKFDDSVAADVSGAAGNEDVHVTYDTTCHKHNAP